MSKPPITGFLRGLWSARPFSSKDMSEVNTSIIENGLRQINLSGRVAKGFNCTVKAIVKNKAQLVFLADDCDNKDYKALITGLCKKYNVKLHSVPQKEILGKALALSRVKTDGTVRRQIKCAACAIVKYGKPFEVVEEFRNAFDPQQAEAAE